MQIFILGMHRSGTSLIARLVNLMGAYFGGEGVALPTNDENPKGFWERYDVVALNERLIAERNSTWFDIVPYAEWARDAQPMPRTTSTDAAIATLIAEFEAHRPWFIKDPRLCLTFGHWRRFCEAPIAVICLRNIGAIAASMTRRSNLTGMSYEQAVTLSKAYLAILARSLDGIPRIVIRYEEFLADPLVQTRKLYESLCASRLGAGLRLPGDLEIERFVEPSLRRSASAAALEPLGAELAAALAEGRSVDEWLDEALFRNLYEVRRSREEADRSSRERRSVAASLEERLSASALRDLLAHDESVNGEVPWTFERLRKLLD